jgi:hypothetical protein
MTEASTESSVMSEGKKVPECKDCEDWTRGFCRRFWYFCEVERSPDGMCGLDGKYFEPKKVDA